MSVVQKKSALMFSGEQMIPEYNKGQIIYFEHLIRYLFASQFVKDKIVLDAACGSGYGSKILALAGAKKVIGVDIRKDVVKYAKENYSHKNIEYKVCDLSLLNLPEKSIDVVVSFETIEHVEDPEVLMKRLKGFLKKDGVAVWSTPDKKHTTHDNEFHLHEMSLSEFRGVLKKMFKFNVFFKQINLVSTSVFDVRGRSNSDLSPNFFRLSDTEIFVNDFPKTKGVYQIAVSSEKKVMIRNYSSLFYDTDATHFKKILGEQEARFKDRINALIKHRDIYDTSGLTKTSIDEVLFFKLLFLHRRFKSKIKQILK